MHYDPGRGLNNGIDVAQTYLSFLNAMEINERAVVLGGYNFLLEAELVELLENRAMQEHSRYTRTAARWPAPQAKHAPPQPPVKMPPPGAVAKGRPPKAPAPILPPPKAGPPPVPSPLSNPTWLVEAYRGNAL